MATDTTKTIYKDHCGTVTSGTSPLQQYAQVEPSPNVETTEAGFKTVTLGADAYDDNGS